jgi:hypothetical protein
VTLSNMSHLVYITLYGETDGVIISRLDCILFTPISSLHKDHSHCRYPAILVQVSNGC